MVEGDAGADGAGGGLEGVLDALAVSVEEALG